MPLLPLVPLLPLLPLVALVPRRRRLGTSEAWRRRRPTKPRI